MMTISAEVERAQFRAYSVWRNADGVQIADRVSARHAAKITGLGIAAFYKRASRQSIKPDSAGEYRIETIETGRRRRPEGAPPFKSILYTVYRRKNDELVAFEETAERAAELMGIGVQTLYQYVWKQRERPDMPLRWEIIQVPIAEMTS